jgi:hypothetical protein
LLLRPRPRPRGSIGAELLSRCSTRRPPWVARPRSFLSSFRRDGSHPTARSGLCLLADHEAVGLPSAHSAPRSRLSADNRGASQSRSRRPASQRASPGSEPSVESIYRLIDGRDRGARIHRCDSLLTLSDISQAAFASSGTPHDDAIPVDLAASSLRSRASRRWPRRPRDGSGPP